MNFPYKQRLMDWMFGRMYLQTLVHQLEKKKNKEQLMVNDKPYPYLFHSYNNMGITERSVEIPIVYHYLTSRKFLHVLEIGNVTNYYEDYFAGAFPSKTVVDKIEVNYNVITCDIAQYKTRQQFDFIFSVSTFEHMDSDLGRNPDYRRGSAKHGTVAADNIVHCYENLLAPGGLLLITAPMGYTQEWDETFIGGFLDNYPFNKVYRKVFRRIGEENWVQQGFDRNLEMKYDSVFPYANFVSVIEIHK